MLLIHRGAPDPDPDPAGYPVNLVDPGRIRPDPMYLDPVRIQIWPDLRQGPVNTGQIYITMI